jgi:L-seryl-tRNA(Ser) seleniumtransferase
MSSELLRQLPSVDRAQREILAELGDALPRVLITSVVRREVESWRARILAGEVSQLPEDLVGLISAQLWTLARSRIQPVINATGVMIHTNLGRSPLAVDTLMEVAAVATGYANVELDLTTGERGRRGHLLEESLACLCGAEAATVVNNCAAALIVSLRALMTEGRKEVIVSRGELVEIGGGFRVPEVMKTSGSEMVEVGTTNKTRAQDYAAAISERTALLLQVHRSNFRMQGFVESPALSELVALGREHGLPVVSDLGSGAMVDTQILGMPEHELTAAELLKEGVDLVLISGDKLLGGPQAGIIAGRRELISKIKREPFFRAVRCDKLVLTALQSTALAYLSAQGTEQSVLPEVRLLQMAAETVTALRARAERLVQKLADDRVSVVESTTRFGGGTMPEVVGPSVALCVRVNHAEDFLTKLRDQIMPIIGYIRDRNVWLDLRTVLPGQDVMVLESLRAALMSHG